MKCTGGPKWYELFNGEEGTHTLGLRKLSENMRGKTALLALETDGEVLPARRARRSSPSNLWATPSPAALATRPPTGTPCLKPAEENGWMTYGAVAARELGAEFNMISVSGISTAPASTPSSP